MEMKMKLIMAILSVALLMLVDQASAQKTYSVSVRRHANAPERGAGPQNPGTRFEDAAEKLRRQRRRRRRM